MKSLEILYKVLLLMVFPTPKNIKELIGLFNEAVAGAMSDDGHKFTEDQWAEIRRMRDAQAREAGKSGKAGKAPARTARKPRRK